MLSQFENITKSEKIVFAFSFFNISEFSSSQCRVVYIMVVDANYIHGKIILLVVGWQKKRERRKEKGREGERERAKVQ